MIQTIKYCLSRPFPGKNTPKDILISAFFTGLFIFLFLFIFKPFNINQLNSGIGLLCLGYGGLTLILTALWGFVEYYILNIQKDRQHWVFWKWILSILMLVFLIALGNYFFTLYYFDLDHSNAQLLTIISNTFLVATFPILFLGTLKINTLQQKFSKIADTLNNDQINPVIPKTQKIEIINANNSEVFKIDSQSILYVEAMQNYVQFVFLESDKIEKKLIRNTLTAIKQQINNHTIVQCHRSFMINTNQIDSIEGNAQGLKLWLAYYKGNYIPVSRKYVNKIREIFG